MRPSLLLRLRSYTVPLLLALVGVIAVGVVSTLQGRADAARVAQNRVDALVHAAERHSLIPRAVGLGDTPAATFTQGSAQIRAQIEGLSAALNSGAPPAAIPRAVTMIDEIMDIDDAQLAVAIKQGSPVAPSGQQLTLFVGLDQVVNTAKATYARRAATARRQAIVGTSLTVMLLLAAFAVYYFRSAREHRISRELVRENAELLEASRRDALTDALTGLRNRRALSTDLSELLDAVQTDSARLAVALFDLDGFKRYNDTFGHAAGDELLKRLGRSLGTEADASGAKAYRLGGDEFCVLFSPEPDDLEATIAAVRAALTDEGAGWTIGASAGVSRVPAEAADLESALVLADDRMYRDKAERKACPSTLQAVTSELRLRAEAGETGAVASMAVSVAEHLGLAAPDLEALQVAADLHDVGKTAIPGSILAKQGELDDDEWAFVSSHTLTGGRLVFAAHASANTAALVRSSHEHFDGTGYPDGLAGASIPLGARIIAVCDAFNAMISERPFRDAKTVDQAIQELRACAGTQFDPAIVDAFAACCSPDLPTMSAPDIDAPPKPVLVESSVDTGGPVQG